MPWIHRSSPFYLFLFIIVSDIDGIIDLDHEYLTYDSGSDDDDDGIDTAQYYIRLDKDGDHKLNRNPHIDLSAPLCYIENGELVCEYGKDMVNIIIGKSMLVVRSFVCLLLVSFCLFPCICCLFVFCLFLCVFWVILLFLL